MAVEKTLRLESQNAFHFPTATTPGVLSNSNGLLRREGDETTVQRRVGKPAGENASFVTERFIRTDARGSSSSARRAILHPEAGYIYADYAFAQLQTSCSSAADHTLTPTDLPRVCLGDAAPIKNDP
jgi:hypothetical protein